MAVDASTVWEVRTTGSNTNGGGFANLNPGVSVDYSQQDNPQLTLSDLTSDSSGTVISSATGGFTPAMVGNIIRISGGGFASSFFQIVSFISSNSVTIDRNAGANRTGGTCSVGGAWKIGGTFDSEFFSGSNKSSGNVIWIKSGTYIATMNIAPINGVAPGCKVFGYNNVRGDNPILSNRPVLNMSSYYFRPSSDAYYANLIFTGSNNGGVWQQSSSRYGECYNCKFIGSGTFTAYSYQGHPNFVSCEFVNTNVNGRCYDNLTCSPTFFNCFFHGGAYGIDSNHTITVYNSVISGCSTAGIYTTYFESTRILGSVIYNCTIGINAASSSSYGLVLMNSIISGCTTGLSFASYSLLNIVDFNCWNNITDIVNHSKGEHCVTGDPSFEDPDNFDFRLKDGSICVNAGLQLNSAVGVV